jgi:RND family efflux transporter MFP subunit
MANEGEVVASGAHLMDLAALDTVYFEARVPELEVSLLRPGAPCEVTVDAFPNRPFPGAVREIIQVLERSTGTFRVRVALLGGRGNLPVGTSARGRINVGTRSSVVAVNRDAVHIEVGGAYVWQVVEGADGSLTARRQAVTLGLMEPRFAEVVSGIREGDRIVSSGSPAITNGTPLSLAEPASAAAG